MAAESPARRRVLIVDDHEATAVLTRLLLQERGHDAEAVANGPDALAAFDRARPDAVLLDLGLPGMDGFEVAAALRERDPERAVLLVALTGSDDPDVVDRCYAVGFDLHATKGRDLAPVLERIEAG